MIARVSAFFNPLPFGIEMSTVALGARLCLAGMLSLIMRQINERGYKDALQKSLALAAAVVLLLPLPAVPMR